MLRETKINKIKCKSNVVNVENMWRTILNQRKGESKQITDGEL